MAKSKEKHIANLYVFNDFKQLDLKSFSSAEQKQLKVKLKENLSYFLLNTLSKTDIYLRVPKRYKNHIEKNKVRIKGADILKKLNQLGAEQLVVDALGKLSYPLLALEGMVSSNYQFLKYFTDKDAKSNSLQALFIREEFIPKKDIEEFWRLNDAVNQSRDLINEPVSFLNSVEIALQMERMGKESGYETEILDHKKIESLKMGGLLAVNKGSVDPATFSILTWKPKNAKNKKPIVLVGKGVVYDTGGLSIKPTANSMDLMKSDMGGAAAVAGTLYAVAANKLPYYVIGLVPATDNRPGGNAYAPGDVIRMYSGSTVEVLNTDAEGRMILADALHYAKKLNPELVIDLATLTGAAVRAIGPHASVIMGTANDKVFDNLKNAGEETYDRVVRFPFFEEYGEEIKSKIADIKNIGGATAGAITAGKFLEHFTDYPWIHIDIAGPSYLSSPSGYQPAGGTGTGVKLLYQFIKNYK